MSKKNGNGKSKELAVKENLEFGTGAVNEAIQSIVDDFKQGIDFDIVIAGKKPTLLIPGADKVNMKFNLMATFRKDTEILEMVQIKGAIPLVCELINRKTGQKVGEGRGASVVGEGGNCKTLNGAIKMAEIRAERDAVLRTFALRERYTQDMEAETNGAKETKVAVDNEGNISI